MDLYTFADLINPARIRLFQELDSSVKLNEERLGKPGTKVLVAFRFIVTGGCSSTHSCKKTKIQRQAKAISMHGYNDLFIASTSEVWNNTAKW